MYSKDFDKKIEDAVITGKISTDDRETLHTEASSMNIDDEELDIVIDGKAYLAKHGKEYSGLDDNSINYTQVEDSVVETTDDDGFDFKKFIKLIMHSRIALFAAIALLVILLWPVLLVILALFASLLPSGSSEPVNNASVKDTTAVVIEKEENVEEEPQKNIEEENIVVTQEGQRCRIEAIDHTLYATVLGDDGSELREKEMKFDNSINEFCCIGSTVYVVVNMLDGEEQSKLPFVGLYKADVYNEKWEFMETSNYITFNKAAKKIHLKTADGLAGECEADGYLWAEKDIDM